MNLKALSLVLLVTFNVQADDELATVIDECAPRVHASTMRAVIATESAGKPYAININGGARLQRQPVNEPEAVATARWLYDNGYNFDAGLAQINSKNFVWLKVTPETIFTPCVNLAAAESVLTHDYEIAAKNPGGAHPVLTALSRYNTGNSTRGFNNGYVGKVTANAARQARAAAALAAKAPTVASSQRLAP
jgi:type IV secretion system protein VirB1